MNNAQAREFKNNQNALRIIKEIMDRMENRNNWRDHGICGMVKTFGQEMLEYASFDAARNVISQLTKEWPHYSGNPLYPVPSNIVGLPQETASYAFVQAVNSVNGPALMWSRENPYGFARRNLLQFLHDQLVMRVNEYENQNSTRYEQDGVGLGDILSAALNNQSERTTAVNTNIDTNTIEGKIAVMQAADRGEKIELCSRENNNWYISGNPIWDWSKFDYRIKVKAKIKDTFDFAGLNQKWKYAARDENGGLYIYNKKPELDSSVWSNVGFDSESMRITDVFETYKIGDVDWKESLISRDEVDTMPRHITDLIRNGHFINAIKEHRQHFGTDLREAKDACGAWARANSYR